MKELSRTFERKHTHVTDTGTGTMTGTVTIDGGTIADGHFITALRCVSPDGRELVIAVGSSRSRSHRTLLEAQDDADKAVAALGHTCDALCETWAEQVTH